MTEKESASRIDARKAGMIAVAVILVAALLAAFALRNRPANGAEAKVQAELDALGRSESVGSEVDSMRNSLSEEGRTDFDSFLKKLRDFDYEITGSRDSSDESGERMTVTVRIRTYDFGREYLATWTEYLKANSGALPEDGGLGGFYEMLFKRLAGLENKEYIKDVDIVCVEPLGNDEWVANIKDNEELQNAVFGGMLSEIETLAAE